MGFAACTNEVEEFVPQVPEQEVAGESLGEDFSINVTKSDFVSDAETRVSLNWNEDLGKWIAGWGDTDKIGAAWFNKVVTQNGIVTNQMSVYDDVFGYQSNAIFHWKEGNEFKADAVVMAGGYVLYYPYHTKEDGNLIDIPVTPIESEQEFNCDPALMGDQISKNITAANVVKFLQNKDNAEDFTIYQIPNLYALSFYIEDESMLKLASTFMISKVMVEATKEGKPAINTDGIIYPKTTTIDKKVYNNPEGVLPEIMFEGKGEKISRMVVNVINEDKDDTYYIKNTGKDKGTGKFYFSMLPTTGEADKITFKIYGKTKVDGKTVTKIFSKEITDTNVLDVLNGKMSDKGEVVNLAVSLTNEDVVDGIYDTAQFIEAWKAGQREFNLATELNLTTITDKKVNFLNPGDAHIVFTGEKVTMPSIKGKYHFQNYVEIVGEATFVSCNDKTDENHKTYASTKTLTIKDGNLKVIGDETSSAFTFGKVNVESGDIMVGEVVDGVAQGPKVSINTVVKANNITANTEITKLGITEAGIVNANANVTFGTVSKVGDVNIAEGVTVKANSKFTSEGNIVNKGTFTAINTVTAKEFTAEGTTTFADANLSKLTAKEGVVFNGKATIKGDVDADATITFEKEADISGIVSADAEVIFKGTATTGAFTANENVTFADVTIKGNLDVDGATVTGNDIKLYDGKSTYYPATISNEGSVEAQSVAASDINVQDTYSKLTTGDIYVNETLTANGKVTVTNTKATDINKLIVNDNIVVDLNGTAPYTVNNIETKTKGDFKGTLNVGVPQISVVSITNNGNINAKEMKTFGAVENQGTIKADIISVEGTFNQQGTIDATEIIVAKTEDTEGTLNVKTNTTAKVTNNGVINVLDGVTFTAEGTNNGTITINEGGKMVESSELALAADSKVTNNGELTLISTTSKEGDVYVKNGSIFNGSNNMTAGNIVYIWTADAPVKYTKAADANKNIHGMVSIVEMDGADLSVAVGKTTGLGTLNTMTALQLVKAMGTITLPAKANTVNPEFEIVDAADLTLPASYTKDTQILYTFSQGINIKAGKKLTVSEKIIFDNNTTINREKGATYDGNKDPILTDNY